MKAIIMAGGEGSRLRPLPVAGQADGAGFEPADYDAYC